jgi:outer membrane protein assembly factor BamB
MSYLRSGKPCAAAAFGGLSFVLAALTAWSAAADWPQWRGARRDGLSMEAGLLSEWPAAGPPAVWRASGAGGGYSGMAITGGRLFTMGARGGTEYVMAFDAATGKKLWETAIGREYRNNRGDGPRGTPTVDGERLYALGGSGDLACLEAATGRKVWSFHVLERFGASNINWGLSESPLVVGEKLLVNAGGRGASIVALNKRDGSVIWKSESDEAGYSSAVPLDVGGLSHAVFFTGERALGVAIDDGRLLWEYSRVSNRTANVATPIVRGNRVFLSSAYGTGCALLELRREGPGIVSNEVYFSQEMRNHHSSSVLVGDHLYGFSDAVLTALRFHDGQVAWKDRSVGKGSLVYADGHLYCFSETGVVGLVEASPTQYREKGRFTIAKGSLPSWTHPVVDGGRLYLRDQDTIYSFDLRGKTRAEASKD